MTIYFANVTRWNSRAVEYMTSNSPMASAHIICAVETHLKGPKLTQDRPQIRKRPEREPSDFGQVQTESRVFVEVGRVSLHVIGMI